MEHFTRKEKEIVRTEDIYPIEQEAQEFLRKCFEKSHKNKYNLYQLGRFENRQRIVSSISQHEVSCIYKEVILNLLSHTAIKHFKNSHYKQIHIGTIMIGIAGLTRA